MLCLLQVGLMPGSYSPCCGDACAFVLVEAMCQGPYSLLQQVSWCLVCRVSLRLDRSCRAYHYPLPLPPTPTHPPLTPRCRRTCTTSSSAYAPASFWRRLHTNMYMLMHAHVTPSPCPSYPPAPVTVCPSHFFYCLRLRVQRANDVQQLVLLTAAADHALVPFYSTLLRFGYTDLTHLILQ